MIIEFFRRGTGDAGAAVDYLLGRKRDREHAQILSGDETEVTELIDSSPYMKKYTAGCLSFFEDDLPPDQKRQIMQDFEKCLFAGLDEGQYRILWVEHRDKVFETQDEDEQGNKIKQRRLELNFLIPNVEINSGKRLQPFYAAADLDRVDCFKQITNHKYQLSDPDDPLNRQASKVAKSLPESVKELKKELETEITLAVSAGIVTDRPSLIQWLTDIGLEVTRQTTKSISIKNPNGGENARPVRLTGEIYEQDFRHTRESADLVREASEEYRQGADSRYTASLERYARQCEAKSDYHRQRFGREQYSDFTAPARGSSAAHTAGRPDQSAVAGERTGKRTGDFSAATAAGRPDQSAVAAIQRLEPAHGTGREAEKSPFYIEFSPDLSGAYLAYFEWGAGLYSKSQKQRDQKQRSQASAKRGIDSAADQGISATTTTAEAIANESGSTVIEHHRAAAASAAERVRALGTASNDNYTDAELQRQISQAKQLTERSKQGIERHHSEIADPRTIREIIEQLTKRLTAAIAEPFAKIGEWAANREPSPSIDSAALAAHGASRDHRPDQAVSAGIEAKPVQFEQLDTRTVTAALSTLQHRKEQQQAAYKAQQRRNDSDYGPGF